VYLSRLLTSDHALIVYAACAAALVAALPSARRRRWGRALRVASAVLLAGGILAVLSTTLQGSSTPTGRVNVVPGASIAELLSDDYRNAAENVVGNVLLFLPLGFFATIVTRWRIARVTLAAAALSTGIELTQLVLGDRWVDIDDVLLNTCGGFLGAVAGAAAFRLATRQDAPRREADSADRLPPGTG
jgi:glycopeptide antibiotics resistance protein